MEYVFLILGLYLLPAIIALGRHHHNPAPVIIVDVFLGWTLIGWVVALAMAFSRPPIVQQAELPPRFDVYTGERIGPGTQESARR